MKDNLDASTVEIIHQRPRIRDIRAIGVSSPMEENDTITLVPAEAETIVDIIGHGPRLNQAISDRMTRPGPY